MKKLVLIFGVLSLMTSCNGQVNLKNSFFNKKDKKEIADSTNNPKVDIKVSKKYDKNGNVIQYDSTYTWSYTNIKGDSVTVNVDTVLNNFKPFFNDNIPDLFNSTFNDFISNDSSVYKNFFRNDYFLNQNIGSSNEVDNIFRKMDSLRNKFFNEFYPGLLPVKK